jgi:hypothetical protein
MEEEPTASEALYRAPMSTRTAETRSLIVLARVDEIEKANRGFTYE